METTRSDLEHYVALAPEGLRILARIFADAINEVHNERNERFGGRSNPQLVHAMIRERVILSAEHSLDLIEAGISVSSGEADSIRVCVEGSSVRPKALHRPASAAAVAEDLFDFHNSELFDQPGTPYFFYSMKDGKLARLTVAQVITDEHKFHYQCEWIDQVVVYDHLIGVSAGVTSDVDSHTARVTALVADPNTDDLDDIVESKDIESSQDLVNQHDDEEADAEQGGQSGTSTA